MRLLAHGGTGFQPVHHGQGCPCRHALEGRATFSIDLWYGSGDSRIYSSKNFSSVISLSRINFLRSPFPSSG